MFLAFLKTQKMIVGLCVALCLAGSLAEVTVENNAYHGLVISFGPDVDSENGKLIVNSLKTLLKDTSDTLHTSIGVRISDVTFRLPPGWDTSTWEDGLTVDPAPLKHKEDILVQNVSDSAFGTRPIALQYGECGVSGHKIYIPASFLNGAGDGYPKEKLLAREWLKYRYGVFDENGYDDDPMYPSYYTIPGTTEAKITECTDPQVEYFYKDTRGGNCSLDVPFAQPDCQIHVEESSLNVTSSLMYYHKELQKVESVCGKNHTHKDFTPSKHNILCNGKSIWEVLEMSPDFKSKEEVTTEAPAADEGDQEIQFLYLQESKPRVVVAFESSHSISKQSDSIQFAIRRLIYDLPDGSDFDLYDFNGDKAITSRPLTTLTKRDLLITSDFVYPGDQTCVTCAISETIEAFGDNKSPGSIIMILGKTSIDEEKFFNVTKKLQDRNLCLTIIAITNEEYPATIGETLKSHSSCSSISYRKNEDVVSKSTYEYLYRVMTQAVPHSPYLFQTTLLTSQIMSYDNALDITVDQITGTYTLWMARHVQAINIECKTGDKDLELTPVIQEEQNFVAYFFGPAEEDVKCKLKYPTLKAVYTRVEMITNPGDYFEEEVWIHDTTETSSNEQMPVIIFSKFNLAYYPIQDAKVVAKITGPKGDTLELDMFDNGKGNPDITQYDGIYSRYFVDFKDEGEYTVTITAKDNGSAKIGKYGTDGCCGSRVKSDSIPVHAFERSLQTSFSINRKKPDEGYKPSRILDLKVVRFDFTEANSIVLNWTAPGSEADKDKVSSYEFHLFCKPQDCEEEKGQLPPWIKFNDSIPNMAGHEEISVLTLDNPPYNQTVYLGLKSKNHKGLYSDMSNLVMVKFPESYEPPTTIDPNVNEDRKGGQLTIRAVVGGSVFGLFLLIVITASIQCFVKKARKSKANNFKDIPQSERKICPVPGAYINPNFDSGDSSLRRVESFPVVLYTHDQIKDVKLKKKEKEPPLYGAVVGPKPWLSLDPLPKREEESDSDGSSSTMPANDSNSHVTEMKQLDDNASNNYEPHLDKVARF